MTGFYMISNYNTNTAADKFAKYQIWDNDHKIIISTELVDGDLMYKIDYCDFDQDYRAKVEQIFLNASFSVEEFVSADHLIVTGYGLRDIHTEEPFSFVEGEWMYK